MLGSESFIPRVGLGALYYQRKRRVIAKCGCKFLLSIRVYQNLSLSFLLRFFSFMPPTQFKLLEFSPCDKHKDIKKKKEEVLRWLLGVLIKGHFREEGGTVYLEEEFEE